MRSSNMGARLNGKNAWLNLRVCMMLLRIPCTPFHDKSIHMDPELIRVKTSIGRECRLTESEDTPFAIKPPSWSNMPVCMMVLRIPCTLDMSIQLDPELSRLKHRLVASAGL